MSDRRERERRREQRLQEEARVGAGDRRQRLLQFAAGAVFLAIVAVVALIVVNSGGSGGDAENIKDSAEVQNALAGIPQRGLVLGDPKAKVELMEFGDLQCPVCKGYSEDILPQVIEAEVESGAARIAFLNFTIIGPQSAPAGAAALAAGAQGRGWNFVELFYRNQGQENSGYADDEFLTAVARAAGVKDIARWNSDRKSAKLTAAVTKATERAQAYGFTGTPSFAIEGPNSKGVELLGTPNSPEEFEAAVAEAG